MAPVGLAIMAVGTLVQTIGGISSGIAAKKASEFNAKVAEQNAALVREQTAEDVRRFRVQSRQALGSLRAQIGGSGVEFTATPLAVLGESAANAEMDALTLERAGENKAKGLISDAEFERIKGSAAKKAGFISAAGTLLSGAGNIIGGLPAGGKGATAPVTPLTENPLRRVKGGTGFNGGRTFF